MNLIDNINVYVLKFIPFLDFHEMFIPKHGFDVY